VVPAGATALPALPNSTRHPALGGGLTMLAMFCFACMDSISKWLVQDFSVIQLLWVRYGFFLGFALLLVSRRGVAKASRSRRPWLQAGRALLAVVEAAVFVQAFYYLPLAETHAIAAASPLLVVLLAVPLLGERLPLPRLLAVLGGFMGVLLIIRPGFATVSPAMLIALSGALLWALYQIMVRFCARYDSSDTTLLWSAGVGLLAISCVGPFFWQPMSWASVGLVFAIAVLGSVAHFSLIKALEYAEAAAVQPFAYTLPLWAALLGALVFGDLPDAWTVAGGAVVIGCGLLDWAWAYRRARQGG
jgi:drug/metabolite transporter (DMT)-like permease